MTIFPWHSEAYKALADRKGGLPHGLLIRGPTGIGKRAFARSLAQGLLCEERVTALTACGTCKACHWFETGNHPDFRLLQPEAAEISDDAEQPDKKKKREISIAQVRSLTDFINISAHRNGAKVILIQPAEAMNVNAANALLKNLEEPPPDTHFLLVSDRPNMLPATIRSRCQQLALRPPTRIEATAWLKSNGVSQPELALALAGGAPILAQELDTPEYWATRQQFLDGLCSRSFDPLALAERFASHAIPQVINWLQCWSYDLVSVLCTQRLRYNSDRRDALASAAQYMNKLEILRFHRDLMRFQRIVNHPLNPRLLLEDLLLRYEQLMQSAHAH